LTSLSFPVCLATLLTSVLSLSLPFDMSFSYRSPLSNRRHICPLSLPSSLIFIAHLPLLVISFLMPPLLGFYGTLNMLYIHALIHLLSRTLCCMSCEGVLSYVLLTVEFRLLFLCLSKVVLCVCQ